MYIYEYLINDLLEQPVFCKVLFYMKSSLLFLNLVQSFQCYIFSPPLHLSLAHHFGVHSIFLFPRLSITLPPKEKVHHSSCHGHLLVIRESVTNRRGMLVRPNKLTLGGNKSRVCNNPPLFIRASSKLLRFFCTFVLLCIIFNKCSVFRVVVVT